MNMPQAVSTVLIKKYATFNGRAGLSEYWWFILFLTLGNLVFSGLDSYLGTTAGFMYQGNIEIKTSLFNGIFSLLTFIPSIAVAARRLHDVNKSVLSRQELSVKSNRYYLWYTCIWGV